MKTKYLFSSPEGDIPAGKAELDMPFKLSPWEDHPFLTVGDYFGAIRDIIVRDKAELLLFTINEKLGINLKPDEMQEVLIRSEKHGALYHISSVNFLFKQAELKFTLSTALSESGKAQLSKEFGILKSLGRSFKLPYLPRAFMLEDMEYHSAKGSVNFTMLLAEWFEDCHEWHLSVGKEHREEVCIWDYKRGHRFATERERFEIFKQVSKILTLYYDVHSFEQIYPWHHAAGDFIVSSGNSEVSVRLTTARNYGPIKYFSSKKDIDPMIGLVYFFLNLSIRIRLDKLDGMGEPVLAEDYSVKAAATGFFEALRIKRENGQYNLGQLDELLSVLMSFNPDELKRLYLPLMDVYEEEDAEDFSIIESGMESHVNLLIKTIQEIRL